MRAHSKALDETNRSIGLPCEAPHAFAFFFVRRVWDRRTASTASVGHGDMKLMEARRSGINGPAVLTRATGSLQASLEP